VSITLFKSLLELKATDAFKTKFLRSFIRSKWDQLKVWIYLLLAFCG
jgi:hypothetical protein